MLPQHEHGQHLQHLEQCGDKKLEKIQDGRPEKNQNASAFT